MSETYLIRRRTVAVPQSGEGTVELEDGEEIMDIRRLNDGAVEVITVGFGE